MAIHLIHGVADNWSRKNLSHRLYVDKAIFIDYLSTRPLKYTSWSPENESGDVLTVDDATRAGAEACMLAREWGHEVTLFINPWQILQQEPYFINLLDHSLDCINSQAVELDSTIFPLNENKEKKKFRDAAKNKLKKFPARQALDEAKLIACNLGLRDCPLPEFLQPISQVELNELARAGVRIENHGWDHREIGCLTTDELLFSIRSTQEWIFSQAGAESSLFAVPFGITEVQEEVRSRAGGHFFLADPEKPLGKIKAGLWNRLDITNNLNKRNYGASFPD